VTDSGSESRRPDAARAAYPSGPKQVPGYALRLAAVGHAFTSEYTRRSRPDLTEVNSPAPVAGQIHFFCYLLYDRLHRAAIRAACHTANPLLQWASEPPDFYLSTAPGGFVFCGFLQRTHAAFKPLNETVALWDPG
jgi:hypothetical protein